MEYIDVAWHHERADDAVRLMSELDSDRYEVRKLEFFPDGSIGFAGAGFSTSQTGLSYVPIPPVAEINLDRQFSAKSITLEEFEVMWDQRHYQWCPPK